MDSCPAKRSSSMVTFASTLQQQQQLGAILANEPVDADLKEVAVMRRAHSNSQRGAHQRTMSNNGVSSELEINASLATKTIRSISVDRCAPLELLGARPTRENVLRRLSEALMRRSLKMIDLSQRGLMASDARLVKLALLQNKSLSVLKLGYNNLGDDGVVTLASGVAGHGSLSSLDLGFNSVGDRGCQALSSALLSTRGTFQTLYLAGNCVGANGAIALASVLRGRCRLRRLHLTGNQLGPRGVTALSQAIVEHEKAHNNTLVDTAMLSNGSASSDEQKNSQRGPCGDQIMNGTDLHGDNDGVQELFLGETGMGRQGCLSINSVLECSASLRVISLTNCGIDDTLLSSMATSIEHNKDHLPIEALQLSFNSVSCKSVEPLANVLLQSKTLTELRLDNNSIGDRGAYVVSELLRLVKTLRILDLGFNAITSVGMKTLMKVVAENDHIESLSISGNKIDTGAAKAVAYALAYNSSLTSLFSDHCSIGHEGQRHVTAGIVSNCGTALCALTGFQIGGTVVSLGFPPALEQWTNEQVLKFIHLMWERMRQEHEENSLEKELDPLNQLPAAPQAAGTNTNFFSGPLEPSTVVAVAKRAFASLGDNSSEFLARQPGRPIDPQFQSPLTEDAVMLETTDGGGHDISASNSHSQLNATLSNHTALNTMEAKEETKNVLPNGRALPPRGPPSTTNTPTVAATLPSTSPPFPPRIAFAVRKKRIVEWLCHNIHHLNELSQLPFDSTELGRLHQHYFHPLIHEIGAGKGHSPASSSPSPMSIDEVTTMTTTAPTNAALSEPHSVSQATQEDRTQVPVSEPTIVPVLKRKVSYRFLQEAHEGGGGGISRTNNSNNGTSISRLIEDMSTSTMQPKSKRARKNRTRISFLPRIKAKVDSYLDEDHLKALILMRQLHFVERCLLNGTIYQIESQEQCLHLFGTFATDAEMILIDMI